MHERRVVNNAAWIKYAILIFIGLAFVFEIIRDVQRDGDFMGYVNAGNAVINGTPIYADYLNTWPPFFSIFSVPLALMHNFSPILIRLIWLVGILVSWYAILRITWSLYYGNSDVLTMKVVFLDWRMLLPFLFVFRFVIDDVSNIQINTYLLLACLGVVYWYFKNAWLPAGVLLGFIIALKVYPVFLLIFFLWKRQVKIPIVAFLALALTLGLSYVVFGTDTVDLYKEWIRDKAMAGTIMTHKNQSLFPWLEGFLRGESRGLGISYNFVDFEPAKAKRLVLGILGLLAMYPAFRFRRKVTFQEGGGLFEEFAVVLACIPILSPLAWKYYFVFLFPIYVVLFNRLFLITSSLLSKTLFFIALGLSILSTDGLVGVYISDVLEVFGCITVAVLLLLVVYFVTTVRNYE